MEIKCNTYKICQFCGKRLPNKDTSRFSLFGIEFNACKECTDKIYDKHIQQNYDYAEIATSVKDLLSGFIAIEIKRKGV